MVWKKIVGSFSQFLFGWKKRFACFFLVSCLIINIFAWLTGRKTQMLIIVNSTTTFCFMSNLDKSSLGSLLDQLAIAYFKIAIWNISKIINCSVWASITFLGNNICIDVFFIAIRLLLLVFVGFQSLNSTRAGNQQWVANHFFCLSSYFLCITAVVFK